MWPVTTEEDNSIPGCYFKLFSSLFFFVSGLCVVLPVSVHGRVTKLVCFVLTVFFSVNVYFCATFFKTFLF